MPDDAEDDGFLTVHPKFSTPIPTPSDSSGQPLNQPASGSSLQPSPQNHKDMN